MKKTRKIYRKGSRKKRGGHALLAIPVAGGSKKSKSKKRTRKGSRKKRGGRVCFCREGRCAC